MTHHRYIPVIHLHPILLLFIVIAFLTGTFVHLFVVLIIVLLHELGHYMMAQAFKWRVRSIMLWVFGGVMETDEHGSRPITEEILVTIAGPLQHLFIYVLLMVVNQYHVFTPAIYEIAWYYNTLILIFNLIPLWPLDGGKLLSLLLSKYRPYRESYCWTILLSLFQCSCFIIIICAFLPFNLSVFLLMLFLWKENHHDWKQRYYVFMRFLLTRYRCDVSIRGMKTITIPSKGLLMDVFHQFYRDKTHRIYIEYPDNSKTMVTENECLHNYFYKKHHDWKMEDIVYHTKGT